MSVNAISFENVGKTFPLYHAVTSGLKGFILNLPKSLASLRHHQYMALDEISFDILRGEVFGVIGRNGAGKSTTLGLAARVIKPTRGKVSVNGRVSPLLELGGGFHPDLTGKENIMLNGVLLGLSRKLIRSKIAQIVDFSELNEFIDEPIRVYSSGMLAKLGFSIVTQLEPEILIIDEVLAVGDVHFQKKCMDAMRGFRKRGVTMLFVSHNMNDIQTMCDRVAWIDEHKIRMIGDSDKVVAEYLRVES